VAKDVPPYLKAVGNPVKLYGLNSVGLQRSGFAEETVRELKRAYRLVFRSELNVSQAIDRARAELRPLPEVDGFLRFIEESQRGVGF
jgi:UDP-N-acetylglucosamine acyltransferase